MPNLTPERLGELRRLAFVTDTGGALKLAFGSADLRALIDMAERCAAADAGLDFLRELVGELRKQRAKLEAERDRLRAENAELKALSIPFSTAGWKLEELNAMIQEKGRAVAENFLLRAENAELRRQIGLRSDRIAELLNLNTALAERVSKQSELLSKRAERGT